MAKLIKQIHDLVDIAFNKGLTVYWPRPKIDAVVYMAVQDLYRTLLSEYPKTQRSRNFLRPLQATSSSITITAGVGTLPTDFRQEIAVWVNDATKKEFDIIEQGSWDIAKNDPVDVPSTTNPKCTIYGSSIEIVPVTGIAAVIIRYHKKATLPVYATIGSPPTYNDATSTDIDFNEDVHDLLLLKVFPILGISVKDFMAVQQSRLDVQKELKV